MSLNPLAKLFKTSLVSSNDEELMKLIQVENNAYAFEILYERHKTSIFRYLTNQMGKAQAEELLQEIFIKLITYKDSFKFESKVKTWLWKITRNALIDYYRSAEHKTTLLTNSMNLEIDEEDVSTIDFESEDLGPEELMIEKTTLLQVETCLNELSAEHKEIVLLHTFSELSYREISEQMNLSLSAVKSLLFRAKIKLVDCFKNGGHL